MGKSSRLKIVFIIFVFCIAAAIASPAQTLTTLASFCAQGLCGGYSVAGLVQGTDGNFYGTTSVGGVQFGPPYGYGTVFKITPGGMLTWLYSFCSQLNCADGVGPEAGLVLGTDGDFYGTTTGIGPFGTYGGGTVFKMTAAGALTTLYSFCSQGGSSCTDGASPYGVLVQGTDGNFYGTTSSGGAYGGGTVFKMTTAGALATLYSFCSQSGCTDGSVPYAGLVQGTDGNFYGTTSQGGINWNYGTVFQITPAGALTTLYSFCSQPDCTDGLSPFGVLVQGNDGNFYGTTFLVGYSYGPGTVFKITPGGTLTTLHNFVTGGGGRPYAGLAQGTDGNFYGTTTQEGLSGQGNGTLFKITPGGTLTALYSFCPQGVNCADGTNPYGGLVQGTDGNFYGTTLAGGVGSGGTVFSLSVGLGGQAVTLSPTSLSFGNQVLDTTSAAKTVTVTNTGKVTLDIGSITASTNFAISTNTCKATLAVGKKCKVSVTFTPTQGGPLTGTLSFTDNAPNSPQTVALSGTGILPATLAPGSAAYKKQKVGTTSKAKTFTLTNNQVETLTGIAISTSGDFAESATTCGTSLAAKGKCTIGVTFTPTATGARTGELQVNNSASNSPQTASLTGTGD